MTKKVCQHDKFTILHAYDEINLLEYSIILTDPEEEVGEELMKHAKILKIRCAACNTVLLAKVFKLDDVIHEN